MARPRDHLTLDLFEVPVPKAALPGALNFGLAVRHLIGQLLKESPLNRTDIAARMAELTGETITKNQLDSWTAESRDGWRFPIEYLPALEVACESYGLTSWLADVRGCKMLVGKDALDAEIGKLERVREEAAKKIRQLKNAMGEQE